MSFAENALPWLAEFRDPPASHRPQPFFVWNGEVTEERITEMLEQFKDRGCGGTFIHPRPGMITEYLSERWFALWSHALAESKRLGLECHVYDENSYPSGFGGGHVVGQNSLTIRRAFEGVEHRHGPVQTRGERLAAWAIGENGETRRLAAGESPNEVVERQPVFTVSLVQAEGRPFSASLPAVDVSLPHATETFLKVTHEAYAARFADDFGKAVRYMFTDEPNVSGGAGPLGSWYLISEFEAEHGYSLVDHLDALFLPTTDHRSVRYDYYTTLNRLFVDNFLRPIHDWCEQHDLGFTGHFWEHMWPDPGHQPDVMWCYRWQQVPAIDLLAFQFFPEDRDRTAIMLLSCKELSSIQRQLQKERTLCETTGAGGYHRTLIDFKPLTDFGLIYGFDIVNPHLSHQTLVGARKYDWAQTYTDHSDWWQDYRIEADHEARLTWALTRGREENRVLLLQPTTTAWFHKEAGRGRRGRESRLDEMQRSQCGLIQRFTDEQIDFDLGDEFVMEESGDVRDGRLVVGACAYELLVIPPMTENLRSATVALLRHWLEGGGTIVVMGPPPEFVDGRSSGEVADLFDGFPEQCVRADGESHGAAVSRVRELCPPYIATPSGAAPPAGLSWSRRVLGDGRFLHVFANPWKAPISTELRLEGRSLVALDTFSGSMEPADSRSDEETGQVITLDLPEAGHAVFVTSGDTPAGSPVARPERTYAPVSTGDWEIARERPNQLCLDYCKLTARGREYPVRHAAQANRQVWRAHGQEGDPWQWAIQYRTSILDLRFPEDSGATIEYAFSMDEACGPEVIDSLAFAVERPDLYRIEVNGERVADKQRGERWWDESMGRFPIGNHVRSGENRVRLTIAPFDPLCEIQPAYLLGEFALKAAETGFRIVPPGTVGFGAWCDTGMPHYAWTVAYRTTLELAEATESLEVVLPEWKGSTIRVVLDGEAAGIIAYPPHELRIDRELAAGKHTLELLVRGNPRNMVGPYFFADRHPIPYAWEGSPEDPPPGKDYIVHPCGLLAPPVVRVGR